MTKKQAFTPTLYLFADEFSENLDKWFSESSVSKYQLDPFPMEIMSNSDLHGLRDFNFFVIKFDRPYKQARVISDYSEQGLMMYQLAATNSHAYVLKNESEAQKLDQLSIALSALTSYLDQSNEQLILITEFRKHLASNTENDLTKLKILADTAAEQASNISKESVSQLWSAFSKSFCAVK